MTAVEQEMPGPDAMVLRRQALVQRLAADPATLAASRQALPTGRDARLDWLLAEIDDTILPRELSLTQGGDTIARLTVSQRRLVAVEMPGRPAAAPEADHQARIFAARLIDLADTRGPLRLRVDHRAAAPDRAEIACSITALRQALDMAVRISPFDRLLALAEPLCLARLSWVEGNPQARFAGEAAWQEPLQALAERILAQKLVPRGRPPAPALPPRTEGVLIPFGPDLVLISAGFGPQGFVAALPRAQGLALIAAWQQR